MDRFEREGLVFDVTDAGPEGAPAVVLLHGWPQDRTAWRLVEPPLHEAGLRTLSLDQRGYSPGACPRGRSAYRMPELVADVVALLDAAGLARAHVVGHDWGGAVAWALAQRRPERVSGLTVLSTPHPAAMAWAMRHGGQARRSWYMLAFQLPWLPELLLRRRLPAALRASGLPEENIRRYADRFRNADLARGGLAWYRALSSPAELRNLGRRLRHRNGVRAGGGGRGTHAISVPTTYIWGSADPVLGRPAAERTAGHVAADFRFVEVAAGHWLPEVMPDVVAREIIARARPTSSTTP